MKSILLTSTALVAFAGAAAADGHANISTALTATLGYNDSVSTNAAEDNNLGFYWEGNVTTTASATLDNGLTASAYFEFTIAEDNATVGDDFGTDLVSSDFVVSLESDTAGLFFGDTSMAATTHWAAAGDMEADGFSTGSDSAVLRGDVTFGGVSSSVSVVVDDGATAAEQLSFGASATFGAISLAAAYQDEASAGYVNGSGDFNNDEVYGVSAAGTFAGATVTVAYAENTTDDISSTGINISYPFGPVTASAYYVMEAAGTGEPDDNYGATLSYASGPVAVEFDYDYDQGTSLYGLEGSYDVGNGLQVFAGYLADDTPAENVSYYVAGEYDLGGGASVLVSYAEDDTGGADDEIGANDYQQGTTIELSFTF